MLHTVLDDEGFERVQRHVREFGEEPARLLDTVQDYHLSVWFGTRDHPLMELH